MKNINYKKVLTGILYFCVSSFFATLVTVLMKKAMKLYHLSEVNGVFWKSFFSFIFILPFIFRDKFIAAQNISSSWRRFAVCY